MKTINEHHRKSIRLKEYDYSQPGEYFVTICSYNQECIFGDVIDGEMRLSRLGEIVLDTWNDLPNYDYALEIELWNQSE